MAATVEVALSQPSEGALEVGLPLHLLDLDLPQVGGVPGAREKEPGLSQSRRAVVQGTLQAGGGGAHRDYQS